MAAATAFDSLADRYDETRGGEPRGAAYAAELDKYLLEGPVLEVGVGTGVVSLGLQRRGHPVVGVDISAQMLAKAHARLGPRVLRGDACALPLGTGSFFQAVAVWAVHSIASPPALFADVARVLRSGGRFVVCPVNRAAPEDRVGHAFEEMGRKIDQITRQPHAPVATAAQILQWAGDAGFRGAIEELPSQSWSSTAEREIRAILDRSWAGLLPLDAEQFEAVTADSLAVLRTLPDGPIVRRAVAEVVILDLP